MNQYIFPFPEIKSGFAALLSHTSGLPGQDVNPRSEIVRVSCAHNAAPELFRLYIDLVIMITSPFIKPKYAPYFNLAFSLYRALMYIPFMSVVRIPTSFGTTMRNSTHGLSIENTYS